MEPQTDVSLGFQVLTTSHHFVCTIPDNQLILNSTCSRLCKHILHYLLVTATLGNLLTCSKSQNLRFWQNFSDCESLDSIQAMITWEYHQNRVDNWVYCLLKLGQWLVLLPESLDQWLGLSPESGWQSGLLPELCTSQKLVWTAKIGLNHKSELHKFHFFFQKSPFRVLSCFRSKT